MNPLTSIVAILSSAFSIFGMGTGAISQAQATRQMLNPPAQVQQQLCQPPMQPQPLDQSGGYQHGYICVQPGQSFTVRQP